MRLTFSPLFKRALVAIALSLVASQATAEDADARALVAQVLEALPKQTFVATLTVTSPDFEARRLQMSRKYVGQTHGSYLEVIEPDDLAGIRFLFLERAHAANEQYIKIKASKSAVRVSDDIRKQPFLGSTFYVSDLVMPELDDYTYRSVGQDVIGGRAVTLVEMTPKQPGKGVYSKTVLALDPKDLLVLRREFYDAKGDKLKIWTVDKVEKIDGIWTMSGQEMKTVKESASSRLDISGIRYNSELPDAMFTPQYLVR